ncbi:ethanolamine ammonia-lyase subunit EutC [Deinococcus apachensis]|uniref:ethanolamine ammonia-lyase subunit EutC n=1 Tax=Deinococcus apachensis TaxID=309886 RepID=UPI0003A60DD9|nr:ethanolamine ammonia-lyase subunit EutC [Deinococcus apachensis]
MTPSPWEELRAHTRARIALGRAGHSLPTREVLAFGEAHARARDAVHTPVDFGAVEAVLGEAGVPHLHLQTEADSRETYLRRPDLGRTVGEVALGRLRPHAGTYEVALVVGDGLSAPAIRESAPPFLRALLAELSGYRLAPVVLLRHARVAAADPIGEVLGARLTLIALGERPGLLTPESLGLYLTYAPRVGRLDAERNCISNIHVGGLRADVAARATRQLVQASLRRELSGVRLPAGDALPEG